MSSSRRVRPRVIFESESFSVVDKPAGLLTLPDRYDDAIPHLGQFLSHDKVLWVHRLDKNTSGLILVAHTPEAHKELNRLFAERLVKKKYLCIVRGRPEKSSWTVDARIKPSTSHPGQMEIHPKGKKSISHFKVKEVFDGFACLEVSIETGRMHQIRLHCTYKGLPILADGQYGLESSFFLSEIKGRKYRLSKNSVERPLLSRSALHAESLSFDFEGGHHEFTAPTPKDMSAVLSQLRKCRAHED